MHLLGCYIIKKVFISYQSFKTNLDMYLRVIVLTLFILLDFTMNVHRISMELPIMYFKGSQLEISKIV